MIVQIKYIALLAGRQALDSCNLQYITLKHMHVTCYKFSGSNSEIVLNCPRSGGLFQFYLLERRGLNFDTLCRFILLLCSFSRFKMVGLAKT